MEGAINCQFLVLRAISTAAAGTGLFQYELRDDAGCCEVSGNTGIVV